MEGKEIIELAEKVKSLGGNPAKVIKYYQDELENAMELLKECQDRLETILVIGVERDEVNMLIKKLNILQNPSA